MAFQQYVVGLRKTEQLIKLIIVIKKNNYLLSQIGKADEMPVYFDMPSSCNVDDIWTTSVAVTLGYEKMHVTLMLAVLADCSKLPPCMILNCRTILRSNCLDVSLLDSNLKIG